MQQLGILEAFLLSGLSPAFLLFGIDVRLRGRYYKEVDIFNEYFHRLVTQVDPMEGQRECAEISWRQNLSKCERARCVPTFEHVDGKSELVKSTSFEA